MYLKLKRALDIFFSFILLIVLVPLFLIIIILLKINRDGKVMFLQPRSGKNNKVFNIYKFRTIDDNNNSSRFCLFLRKTGFDELPQLFNILKGEMSFIGPRPWIVEYSKYFNKKQFKRLEVLPGLTGYAQIYNCKDVFEKINRDCYYVDNVSFLFDVKIIFNTFKLIFSNSKSEITEVGIEHEIELLKKQKRK